jgi:Sec-independent protein translocase protein TatA
MNLFGIGNLEIIIILLVALMVLGPSRMVDGARTLGKFWNDAQRTLRAAADAATIKLDETPSTKAAEPVEEPEDAVARATTDDGDADDTPDEQTPRG